MKVHQGNGFAYTLCGRGDDEVKTSYNSRECTCKACIKAMKKFPHLMEKRGANPSLTDNT